MVRRGQWFVYVCVCTVTASVVYLTTSSYSSHGGWLHSGEAPREERLCGPAQQWDATTGEQTQTLSCPGSSQTTQTSVRDILSFTPWPEKQPAVYLPGLIPPVVHYVWCGNKKFRFHDYLSVLSAIKLIRPLKLVVHYTHRPQTDSYNTWFEELKSSVAGLELQELPPNLACGSKDLLRAALGTLASHGGVLISGSVILSRFPRQLTKDTSSIFAFAPKLADSTLGVVFARSGFDEATKNSYLETIDKISSGSCNDKKPSINNGSSCCVTIGDYNTRPDDAVCFILTEAIHPRDVIEARTHFAELARWLFYGNRAPALPTQDFQNLIPRISHFIRLTGSRKPEDQGMYKEEFSFNHMLNILSALYVAGFEQVFIHLEGDEPTGRWWEEIKKEKNVTVRKALRPSTVYQHKVEVVQHVSDVLRYLTVYTYGGAYQDFDVTWYTRVPDSLLAYPAVAGLEWEQKDKEWPESFNLGVFFARPGAEWFRHYIDTHKDFKDRDWGFNSLRMSYKTYELYPHLLLLDRKLQVICCNGKCHPAWEKNYQHSGVPDNLPTMPSSWQEVRAVHVTCPKPHPSLASPDAIKQRKDMMAEIGRTVLNKSGRQYLLS